MPNNYVGFTDMTGTSSTTQSTTFIPIAQFATLGVKKEAGISPQLYFTYVKSKFRLLERMRMDRRIKLLTRAFDKAVDNGQDMLARKVLNEVVREGRESVLLAKGIKHFIERSDLNKYKLQIRGGHISDTQLEDYTRVIPDSVIKKLKEVKGLFDGFVIYHYWNPDSKDVKKMSREEKERMKDPVLFGYFKQKDKKMGNENSQYAITISGTDDEYNNFFSTRLYFIADWEDEFCDLTFDEMCDAIGKDESEFTLNNKPVLES